MAVQRIFYHAFSKKPTAFFLTGFSFPIDVVLIVISPSQSLVLGYIQYLHYIQYLQVFEYSLEFPFRTGFIGNIRNNFGTQIRLVWWSDPVSLVGKFG